MAVPPMPPSPHTHHTRGSRLPPVRVGVGRMLCRREEIQKGLAMREFYRRKQSGDDLFDDDEGDGTAVRVLGDSDGDSTAGDTRRSAA